MLHCLNLLFQRALAHTHLCLLSSGEGLFSRLPSPRPSVAVTEHVAVRVKLFLTPTLLKLLRDLAGKRRQAQPNDRRGEEKPTVVSYFTSFHPPSSIPSNLLF